MKIPRYKEFDAIVTPVIISAYNKVRLVTKHPDGEEITSLLDSRELRELADYLDFLSNYAPKGAKTNKDLTATQQVASPKSASQTSLNPDIIRNPATQDLNPTNLRK